MLHKKVNLSNFQYFKIKMVKAVYNIKVKVKPMKRSGYIWFHLDKEAAVSGVLRKRCSENMQQQSNFIEATLLKSHFNMGVLL